MSWLGIHGIDRAAFNPWGIGFCKDNPGAGGPGSILPRGSLLMEFRHRPHVGAPQWLLRYRREEGWSRGLDVRLDHKGVLSLRFWQGKLESRARLPLTLPRADRRLRLTYAWDAPARVARLTVEVVGKGQVFHLSQEAPLAWPMDDVAAMMQGEGRLRVAPQVQFFAFSNVLEPVALGGGVAEGTPVLTPQGNVAVEKLQPGDLVVTERGETQPVLWVGKRSVPAMGSLRPIELRAPFFGLQKGLLMAPDHRVALDLPDADYQIGHDEVLLQAERFLEGRRGRRNGDHMVVTYYQVLLENHACLRHDTVFSESLFVGSLARRPDLIRATILADMPAETIPRHRAMAHHPLSDFEARGIADALRA